MRRVARARAGINRSHRPAAHELVGAQPRHPARNLDDDTIQSPRKRHDLDIAILRIEVLVGARAIRVGHVLVPLDLAGVHAAGPPEAEQPLAEAVGLEAAQEAVDEAVALRTLQSRRQKLHGGPQRGRGGEDRRYGQDQEPPAPLPLEHARLRVALKLRRHCQNTGAPRQADHRLRHVDLDVRIGRGLEDLQDGTAVVPLLPAVPRHWQTLRHSSVSSVSAQQLGSHIGRADPIRQGWGLRARSLPVRSGTLFGWPLLGWLRLPLYEGLHGLVSHGQRLVVLSKQTLLEVCLGKH
mmetsp:Transcript_159253/g.510916  ORF Transcript_159253/g.510916 Transcript_159253/m.510916 type:complete len:295 (-) Transcript_159253:299-1183(-)